MSTVARRRRGRGATPHTPGASHPQPSPPHPTPAPVVGTRRGEARRARTWQVVVCKAFLASSRGKGRVVAIHPGKPCKTNCKHFPCVAVIAGLQSELAVRRAFETEMEIYINGVNGAGLGEDGPATPQPEGRPPRADAADPTTEQASRTAM